MHEGCQFMLGVVNSHNVLCSAMSSVFGTITSSLFFLEYALIFNKLGELSCCLLVFLFALIVFSISRSNTSAPVQEDLGIYQLACIQN